MAENVEIKYRYIQTMSWLFFSKLKIRGIDKMASADLLAFENRIKKKYEVGSKYSWEAAAQSIVNAYKQICNNG